jgi:hemerythrin superfamily protein
MKRQPSPLSNSSLPLNVNNTDKKSGIVEKITAALEAHAAVEEEFFYPAVKKARAEKTKDEVREDYDEHRQIKALPAALSETDPRR